MLTQSDDGGFRQGAIWGAIFLKDWIAM